MCYILTNKMIPKVIHYCWFSTEEKPDIIKSCIQSWQNVLIDYELKEWTLNDFDYKMNNFTTRSVYFKKWAFTSDYFRLWVLYNYGGIYLDCDVIVNKTFERLLFEPLFLGWENLDSIEAHVIGAVQGHKWLYEMLKYYDKIDINFIDDFRNYLMPNVITHNLVDYYHLKRNFKKQKLKNDITVYPIDYFTLNVENNNNVCEHLFLGSWDETKRENYLSGLKHNYYDIYSSPVKRNLYFIKRSIKNILNI